VKIDKIIPLNILNAMNPDDRATYAPGQLTIGESNAKADSKLEKVLHDKFINFLHLKDLDFCHARTDKKSSIEVGRSDFLVWNGIRLCFIEFKAHGGRLSEAQKDFILRQQLKHTPILVTKDLIQAMNFVTRHLLWTEPQNATSESSSTTTAQLAAGPTGSSPMKATDSTGSSA
jgi:hypothetical protein